MGVKLFGPKKPFVKYQPTYSVKLVFSYVVKGIKIQLAAKFHVSRHLCFEDNCKENYVIRNAPDFRETGLWSPGSKWSLTVARDEGETLFPGSLSFSHLHKRDRSVRVKSTINGNPVQGSK